MIDKKFNLRPPSDHLVIKPKEKEDKTTRCKKCITRDP